MTRCRCVYDKEKKRLIAFYEGTADAASLRAHALETLPPFMMPTKILPIEAMPLTKNGKVDRAALLALSREAAPVAAPDEEAGERPMNDTQLMTLARRIRARRSTCSSRRRCAIV